MRITLNELDDVLQRLPRAIAALDQTRPFVDMLVYDQRELIPYQGEARPAPPFRRVRVYRDVGGWFVNVVD